MLINFLRGLWIKAPKSFRRLTVNLIETRFHVTVGGIIQNEKGEILLLKHVFRVGSGWGIPGGFVSKGEQPADALVRELEEETGLKIENVRLAYVHTLEKLSHIEIIFLANARGEAKALSMEITQAGWFSMDALPDELHRDQLKVIKRTLGNGEIM